MDLFPMQRKTGIFFISRHPEYMFQKYEDGLFPLSFTARRECRPCYRKWNVEEEHE